MKITELDYNTPILIQSQEELDLCIRKFKETGAEDFALSDYYEREGFEFFIGFCTSSKFNFTSGFNPIGTLPEEYLIISFQDFKNANS